MLDDQSTISMVDPIVSFHFRVERKTQPIVKYTMSTMERMDSPHEGYSLFGLEISPLGAPRERIVLPACVESTLIPEAFDEVPEPDEVARMPGFRHLKGYFPEKDPEWCTVLLIGSNCGEAMFVRQCLKGTGRTPHALQTNLGWTLVGVWNERTEEPREETGRAISG